MNVLTDTRLYGLCIIIYFCSREQMFFKQFSFIVLYLFKTNKLVSSIYVFSFALFDFLNSFPKCMKN